MKKKTRFKSKTKNLALDFLVFLACASVFAASIWLFWNDLNKSSSRSDKDAIATITFKYKVAQRKFTDRVVWERLQQNSPLYDQDTIRTSDLASATITFSGGEVLAVHENTMVQIFKSSDGGVRLSVGGGGVDVDTSDSKSGASLAIQMQDGSQVALEAGSRLSATSLVDGQSSLQLQSGSGVVSGESSDIALSAGETVKVEKGQVQKVPLSVTSVSSDLWILNSEKTPSPVHLEWVASESDSSYGAIEEENSKRYVVQTSRSKDFDVIDSTITVQNLNYADIPVTEGNVYWRVYEEAQPEKAVNGKIHLQNLLPPELSSPAENSVYKYRKNLPQIPFSWEESQLAQYYRLEISDSPDFFNSKIKKDVQDLNCNISELDEGTWFWRVTPFYNLNNTGFKGPSKISSFKVAKAEAITNPVTVSPADNAKLFYVTDTLNTSFRWKKEDLNAQYELFLSDTEDFSSIIYSTLTSENSIQKDFSVENLPVGTYWWKVCRYEVPEEGLEREWSDAKTFEVALYSPKKSRILYPPDNFYTDSENLMLTSFSWKPGDEFNGEITASGTDQLESVIQFSNSQDFSSIILQKKTSENQIDNLSLEGGKYFWRVGMRASSSAPLQFTQVQSLTVLKELLPVNISSPLSSQTVLVSEVRPLRVGWQPCDGADYYVVQLFNKKDGSLLSESKVKDNFAVFNTSDFMDSALMNLVCSVHPVANATEYAAERVGKESSVEFSIRKPDPVKLLSPLPDSKIAGLDALRNPLALTWKEGFDIPQRSQFVIQKLQPGGNYRDYHIIENPSKEINLEGLTAGSYRWIINASLADGSLVNASSYSYFNVTPVPELERPVLNEPEKGYIMNADFFRKHRSLRFSWSQVADATDYTFTLYKKTADGKLLHVSTVKNGRATSLNFRDLKLLDVGEFEWQVTAYSINKKGFEEQHSKAASGSFRIDIKLPKTVNVKNPGEIFIE